MKKEQAIQFGNELKNSSLSIFKDITASKNKVLAFSLLLLLFGVISFGLGREYQKYATRVAFERALSKGFGDTGKVASKKTMVVGKAQKIGKLTYLVEEAQILGPEREQNKSDATRGSYTEKVLAVKVKITNNGNEDERYIEDRELLAMKDSDLIKSYGYLKNDPRKAPESSTMLMPGAVLEGYYIFGFPSTLEAKDLKLNIKNNGEVGELRFR